MRPDPPRLTSGSGPPHRPESLALSPLDLGGIGAAAPFEVQVLADRVVQQTHSWKALLAGDEVRRRAGVRPHGAVLALPLGCVQGGVGVGDQALLVPVGRPLRPRGWR